MTAFVTFAKKEIESQVHFHKDFQRLGWASYDEVCERIKNDIRSMVERDKRYHKGVAIKSLDFARFTIRNIGHSFKLYETVLGEAQNIIDMDMSTRGDAAIGYIQESIENMKNRLDENHSKYEADEDSREKVKFAIEALSKAKLMAEYFFEDVDVTAEKYLESARYALKTYYKNDGAGDAKSNKEVQKAVDALWYWLFADENQIVY